MAATMNIENHELSEEEQMYKENIIDHYKHPRNKRELPNPTHAHSEHNPLCGDRIAIYLQIRNNKVEDVSFTGDGCAISQASASLITGFLKDKTMEQLKQITEEDIFNLLGIPISHTRIKCALLALKTVHGAIEQ